MAKTNKKKDKKGGYLSRTQAIRHLQVSIGDFRRLCILKGIYPRELSGKAKKKIQKGSTKPITAYYRKDIQYLLHEPLLQKFRDHKIFARKLTRAIGRGDMSDAKRIDDNRPKYTLDHIIKERYPTFQDALGDIDDALSMLFLFAMMPSTDKVSHRITNDCERLATEWMALVAREGWLRKVFVSIKGVYYQAHIRGQDIMWVVPFKFPQNVPTDIDFRIMLTFLEFYTTLIHFVLYRLYTESGLVYPPTINERSSKGIGGISGFILESTAERLPTISVSNVSSKKNKDRTLDSATLAKASKVDKDVEDAGDDASDSDEEPEADALDEFKADAGADDADELVQPELKEKTGLFSKFKFYIGREVPLDIMEVLILAFGGKFVSESALDELVDNEDETVSNQLKQQINVDGVTHQICDRPSIPNRVPGRVYVQPQWIMDSINQGKLLPISEYAPGETLPPHLSPWGDRGTCVPETSSAAQLDAEGEDLEESASDAESDAEAEIEAEIDEDAPEDDDEQAQKELQMEAAGVKFSEAPAAKPSKKRKAEDEDKELRKMMMSNKQRKLYEKMKYSNDKKQAREDTLRKKRVKLDAMKKKLQ